MYNITVLYRCKPRAHPRAPRVGSYTYNRTIMALYAVVNDEIARFGGARPRASRRSRGDAPRTGGRAGGGGQGFCSADNG